MAIGIPNLAALAQLGFYNPSIALLLGGQQGADPNIQTAPQPFGFSAPAEGAANPFKTLAQTVSPNMFMNQAAADIFANAMGAPATGAGAVPTSYTPKAPTTGSRSRITIPPKRLATVATPKATTATATKPVLSADILANIQKLIAANGSRGTTRATSGASGPAKSPQTIMAGIGGIAGNGGGQFDLNGILSRLRGIM